MSLDFSALHLVIGEESPSAEGLKPAFSGAEDKYTNKDTCYLILKENLDDKYFWLCARYGKSLPYSSTVYNTKDQTEEDNPRSTDQIEPDKQLFALYCIHSRTLYMSKAQQKSWVEEYLKEKLKQDVRIKAFFKNVDEFLEQIKSVEKVRFVVKNNLFTPQGGFMKILHSLNDLCGLGVPAGFTFEANFANASLKAAFKEYFKKMVDWKKNYAADSLVCIGRDDKNFEAVFNVDSFIQKISVEATKDDQGLYDPATVKQALIRKIEGYYE